MRGRGQNHKMLLGLLLIFILGNSAEAAWCSQEKTKMAHVLSSVLGEKYDRYWKQRVDSSVDDHGMRPFSVSFRFENGISTECTGHMSVAVTDHTLFSAYEHRFEVITEAIIDDLFLKCYDPFGIRHFIQRCRRPSHEEFKKTYGVDYSVEYLDCIRSEFGWLYETVYYWIMVRFYAICGIVTIFVGVMIFMKFCERILSVFFGSTLRK
jgi:hypothetical protein